MLRRILINLSRTFYVFQLCCDGKVEHCWGFDNKIVDIGQTLGQTFPMNFLSQLEERCYSVPWFWSYTVFQLQYTQTYGGSWLWDFLEKLLNPLSVFGNLPIFCLPPQMRGMSRCPGNTNNPPRGPGQRWETMRALLGDPDQKTAPGEISVRIISAVKLRSWNPIVFFFLSICQSQDGTWWV